MLNLTEHYLSIQGEGLNPGKLTYFVRFALCNLRCDWCDSTYTFKNGTPTPIHNVVSAIQKSQTQLVCLTGGEPLLHEKHCVALIKTLPKIHFDIETGGSLAIENIQFKNSSVIMDWKLASSKMSHKMRKENLKFLRPKQDLLKLVTNFSKTEQKEILSLIRSTEKLKIPISIQPVHGLPLQALAEWIIGLKNSRIQVNLQLQKYIWPATQRKV